MTSITQGHNYKKLRLDSWFIQTHVRPKAGWVEKMMILSLLGINIIGSLAMGLLIGWFAVKHPFTTPDIKLFVMVGIMGGHAISTSFSLDMLPLLRGKRFITPKSFMLCSVTLSLAALMAGIYAIRLI